jgi:hypothetical protein
MGENTETSGMKIVLIIVVIILVLAGGAFLLNQKYHFIKWKKKATDTLQVNTVNTDSLQIVRKENIRTFVIEFLSTVKTDESLSKYYAENVQRCYLKENLTLSEVIKEKKYYKRIHPRAKVILIPSSININLVDSETAEVSANADYYADSLAVNPKQIVYQLKIDKNNKVFYINNPEN